MVDLFFFVSSWRLAGRRHRKLHRHLLPQRRRPAGQRLCPRHRRRDSLRPPPAYRRQGQQARLTNQGRAGLGGRNQIHRRVERCDWSRRAPIKLYLERGEGQEATTPWQTLWLWLNSMKSLDSFYLLNSGRTKAAAGATVPNKLDTTLQHQSHNKTTSVCF